MKFSKRRRWAGSFLLALGIGIALPSCGGPDKAVWKTRDAIPPEHLTEVMQAHYRGLGAMENFRYADAAQAFREVHDKAPGWIAGTINLAIALLNQGGEAADKAKQSGQAELAGVPKLNIDEAEILLGEVLVQQPKNPWALFSRGIILKYKGQLVEAHRDFGQVVEIDPRDGHAWLELGSTLTDPDQPWVLAERKQARRLIEIYSKALEANPFLVPALYKLQLAYGLARDPARQEKVNAAFLKFNPENNAAATGEVAKTVYGLMGHYASIIDPFASAREPAITTLPPRFAVPAEIHVTLSRDHRWSKSSDFSGPFAVLGRVRSRFGQGVATFDANGDGRLDLYLTAAVIGPKGLHDVLLLNRGENRFEDATVAFGLPEDRAGLGVAAGDFDADRRVDLFLTGIGDHRLYRNLGSRFEDVTKQAGIVGSVAISPSARWLDLDQDGDLDLYVLNYAPAADVDRAFTDQPAPPGVPNVAYRNDGKASRVGTRPENNWAPLAVATPDLAATEGLSIAFSTAFPGAEALAAGKGPHTAIAALDIDDDRDIDLVVSADGEPCQVILNDRAGAFHGEPLLGLKSEEPIAGLLVTDLNKDGRPDLVAVGPVGRVNAWENATSHTTSGVAFQWERRPIDARTWRAAQAVDLDLDTWTDLLGLPIADPMLGLSWSRNDGKRQETLPLALGPDGSDGQLLQGFAVADLVGDPLPDLVLVRDGLAPRVARNLGNGRHWLAIDLAGRWRTSNHDPMRTNSEGLGARLLLEGQGISVPYDHTTTSAGLGQSVGPVVLGMGSNTSAALLHIRWPDGVLQCELNVTADKTLALAEQNRKTGSCPVLFTWNGARFECLGDFLGGGGLGYLVAPGVYGQPDRDESVAIAPDQLKAVDGVYRLSVVEPMDEVAYLDKLTLDVVDRPSGISATPDERFAPEGPRPTGDILAWSKAIEPARALDHQNRDVTADIRAWDRRTVDHFHRLRGWIGYTEGHALILDFEDRLSHFDPDRKLVLCLAGWVEYPYSQTNYAAATAGVALRPPVLERRRDDGSWEVIDSHPGYPAGLPRMMTVNLTGKTAGPRCILRLTTNMELYWDQAFVAVVDPSAQVQTTSLPVTRASLGDRGYLREVSPDGRLPLLYDYDHVDPAPLARMKGFLTRHGDVTRLLAVDDDQLCTVGPGDEARLEFEAKGLPILPEGWTRSFVLRTVGYCKDADPFTAGSDSVGPLPWRAMPPYPFPSKTERPTDPDYAAYLREYQTRPAGVR